MKSFANRTKITKTDEELSDASIEIVDTSKMAELAEGGEGTPAGDGGEPEEGDVPKKIKYRSRNTFRYDVEDS